MSENGEIIYRPQPVELLRHNHQCDVQRSGGTSEPVGTVYRCNVCGTTWVARNVQQSGYVLRRWMPETKSEQRQRKKHMRRQKLTDVTYQRVGETT